MTTYRRVPAWPEDEPAPHSERDRGIVALVDAGATAASIARDLGISRQRVAMVYRRMTGRHMPRRAPRTSDCPECGPFVGAWSSHARAAGHPGVRRRNMTALRDVASAYRAGESAQAIAHRMAMKTDLVLRWLHAAGVPIRPVSGRKRDRYRPVGEHERAAIIAAVARGESWSAVSKRTGRAIAHLRTVVGDL